MRRSAIALLLIAMLGATPLAAAESATTLVGKWRGSYSCLQGHTGLLLTIGDAVGAKFSGEFAFFPLDDNPKVPKGRFAVAGAFNSTLSSVEVKGVRWIEQPSGYLMVDLSGTLSDDGRSIDGKVEFSGCTSFHVTREGDARPTTKAKGS
jgi:hypothetical protein